ncbi:hypothetical protein [Cocleimonas flava]|uniref:hypothetical protein n=1 Tax=Cocleimonas flava TaxID=634765 RepID=UPI001FB47738|nr:hypothetical protein [Cocleimonas flava]
MTKSLSIQQARKLVLLSQRLPPSKQSGSAMAATLSAIEHIGYNPDRYYLCYPAGAPPYLVESQSAL